MTPSLGTVIGSTHLLPGIVGTECLSGHCPPPVVSVPRIVARLFRCDWSTPHSRAAGASPGVQAQSTPRPSCAPYSGAYFLWLFLLVCPGCVPAWAFVVPSSGPSCSSVDACRVSFSLWTGLLGTEREQGVQAGLCFLWARSKSEDS